MEEVLDDDDDDEMKVEKSSVEKMEKHSKPETPVPEPVPAGTLKILDWRGEIYLLAVLHSPNHTPKLKY